MGLIDLFFFIHEYSNLFINIILVQSFPFFNFQSFRLKNFISSTEITRFSSDTVVDEGESYRYWDTGPRECSDIKTLRCSDWHRENYILRGVMNFGVLILKVES